MTIAGNLQDELGCAGDWQADCAATHLAFDADDTVWQATFAVPAGSYEYKATLNDCVGRELWGQRTSATAPNIPLSLSGRHRGQVLLLARHPLGRSTTSTP